MKKLFLFLSIVCLSCVAPKEVLASHIIGGEVSYECLNACTTRVHVTYFRDCTGIISLSPNTFAWNNLSGSCTAPVQLTPWTTGQSSEITPVCPGTPTWCNTPGAQIGGVERVHFSADFETCSAGTCEWELQVTECCRNSSIVTFTNSYNTAVGLMRTRMITAPGFCNNSPVWEERGPTYLFNGQQTVHNMGAYDPDGDSLVFVLDSCWHASNQAVTYSAGYSPQAPLGPTWNVSMDRETGEISFSPNPGNLVVGVICMLVKEYRNGVQIGQVQRDVQVTVVNNPTNTNPILSMPVNMQGNATLSGNSIYLCAPGPICFDMISSDVNAGQALTLQAHTQVGGASFLTLGSSGTGMDTLTGSSSAPPAGTFCWTPPSAGVFYVWFEVKDDACPLNGTAQRVVRIVVGNNSYVSASAAAGVCPSVQFSSTACMGGALTYQWSGAGGFNSSLANPVHAFPGPGSYPWELIVGNGIVSDTIRDTVVVDSLTYSPFLSGTYLLTPCTGNVRDTIAGPSGYASYEWSTGASTQDLPVFLGGNYSLTVTDAQSCRYHDSIEVLWVSPELFGIATTSLQTPLQNQKIYLIDYDPSFQTLTALDSTWTDSSGYYYFCFLLAIDSTVLLKAAPRAIDYPNEMPTYADTSILWSGALNFDLTSILPHRHDFQTLAGINPGGTGFIGGLISQGANKRMGPGDPVAGLDVFLRNAFTKDPVAHRVTGPDGRFSVAGLAYGSYEVVVDKPLINSTDSVPVIVLNAQQPVRDNLDFRLHSTYLEWAGVLTQTPAATSFSLSVAPNPFQFRTTISLELPESMEVELILTDVLGREVWRDGPQKLSQGTNTMDVGRDVQPGCLLLTIKSPEQVRQFRLLKLE